MGRITLLFLAILYLGCQPWESIYNPDSPTYVYPTFEVDRTQSTALEGDTLKTSNLKIVLVGNDELNLFRWRLDSTEWSDWTGDDKVEYTISLSDLDTGWHTIDVQTCYDPVSNTSDTTIKFYQVILPSILVSSDTLIHRYIQQPCTLWVTGTGSEPLEYLWLKDGTETTYKSDTVILSAISVEHAGTYQCRLSNLWGHVFSDSMRVVVEDTTTPDFIKDSLHLATTENTLLDINLRDSCFAGFSRELTFHTLSTTLAGDSLYPTGRYTFSPSYTDSGRYRVSAYVTNGTTNDSFAIGITVKNLNRAPVFQDSLPKTFYQIDEGSLLSISLSATDADGDSISLLIKETNLPHKDDCVLADSTIMWQSQHNDNGAYYLKVSATDGADITTASIDIGVGNVNLPPRISIEGVTDGGTLEAKENDTLRFTLSVTDPNYGDKVTLPAGRNMPFENPENGVGAYDTATGEFWFVPDFSVSSQEGNERFADIFFIAIDNSGQRDSLAIDILVENKNRAPTISLVSPTNGMQGVAKNGSLKWTGKDSDSDLLTYTLFLGLLPDQFEQVYRGTDTSFSDSALFINGQTYYWKVLASDGISQSESTVRSFVSNNQPEIAILHPLNGQTALDVPVELSWQGSDSDVADRDHLLYDVYLSSNNGDMSRVAENLKTSSLLLSNIDFGTRYEWKVIAKDGKNSVPSPSYSFQTASVAKVTTHPKSQTAINSESVSFKIQATGDGTIEYQWLKNGNVITGANESSYTIGAANSTDHNAVIRCIVSNGFGTPDTSTGATLNLSFIIRTGESLHASISPSIDTVPFGGESAAFTVQPADGWFLDGVYSGTVKIANDTIFTVENVRADLTIYAKCGNWEYVGSPNASNGDAFFVNMEVFENKPIIAYQDVGNGRALSVKAYESTLNTWQNVGDAPALLGANVWGISLAVENNQPFIAVADPGFDSKVTVIKLVGGSWEVVGSRGFSAYSTSVTDICVSSGVPYVAYVRSGFGDSRKLVVMRYNGGTWDYINESEISSKYAQNPKIYVNSGRPYVAFQDWAINGKVSIKWNNGGGSWLPYGSPDEPDTVEANEMVYLDFKFDNGVPYIYYHRWWNPEGGILKCENGSWTHLAGSEFTHHANYISLDFFNHTPYISYMDQVNDSKATVMKWNGSGWDTIGKKGFTAEASHETTIRIINGTPYLSYRSSSAHVMRYITE